MTLLLIWQGISAMLGTALMWALWERRYWISRARHMEGLEQARREYKAQCEREELELERMYRERP